MKGQRCTGRFLCSHDGCVCIECGRKTTLLNALRWKSHRKNTGKETLMKKIISLFQRNYDGDRLVRDEIVPGAEWVIAGEGTATQKLDGTCCMVRDGKLYRRYDAKAGKAPPPDFEPAQEEPDPETGHWPGWVPVGDGPVDRWHREALKDHPMILRLPGTYELIGPKIQGNPERVPDHRLFMHGAWHLTGVPADFDGLREYLATHDIEGIVWHHRDGRMCKLKAKDYGLKRGERVTSLAGVGV